MTGKKGVKFTEEHKQKIAASLRGKKKSPEHNEHNRLAHIGKHLSEETKQKLSQIQKGVPKGSMSEETKQRISQSKIGTPAWNKGVPLPEEQKQKIREAKIGKPLTEEHKQKLREAFSGDKCHLWKGGISFEPYCVKFSREFKERVRKFFNRTCAGCGITETELGRKLDVHHVNFNKSTCCDDTIPLFVPLCRSCHSKTRHNLEMNYEVYYTKLINEKYNGKCYLPKDLGE